MMSDKQGIDDIPCICKGNWRSIIKESEPLFGKEFKDGNNVRYRFIGVMHCDDDYYYCMWRNGDIQLLSCVCSIEQGGYSLIL